MLNAFLRNFLNFYDRKYLINITFINLFLSLRTTLLPTPKKTFFLMSILFSLPHNLLKFFLIFFVALHFPFIILFLMSCCSFMHFFFVHDDLKSSILCCISMIVIQFKLAAIKQEISGNHYRTKRTQNSPLSSQATKHHHFCIFVHIAVALLLEIFKKNILILFITFKGY